MDTAIRTLRPETSKKWRPSAPRHPSSAGSSQTDLNALILKELDLQYLEGEMLGSITGKMNPEWRWLKDKEGKSLQK